MFRIPPAYRFPLVIALILHICLIIFLFIHLPAQNFRLPGPVAKQKTKVVQAVAVDEKQIQAQVARIKHEAERKRARERARVRRLEAKVSAARKARLEEQRRVKKLKAQQLAINKRKATEAARLKALQQKSAMVLADQKKLQQKRAKMLENQEKQLQQKLIQQQLSSEQNQLAQAKAAQQRGLIDRYKAGILRAIGQEWVVPGGANKNLSCIYRIQLAPGGVVVSVKLLRSSGNPALDRSARVAIFKASPLPVPKDPALFDNFRELRLTVSPKTVVKEQNETS